MAQRRSSHPAGEGGPHPRTSKFIDIALLAGIGLVAVAIGWTLFGQRREAASPLPAVVTLVDTERNASFAVLPSGRERDAKIELTGDLTPVALQAGVGANDLEPAAPWQPLDRIAFSYVTGGAGACGVVLEAWRHVAVSRDLLSEHGCGAIVTLTLDDEVAGRRSVTARIGDTMNPVHERTVNIYVGRHETAASYGVTSGSLQVER